MNINTYWRVASSDQEKKKKKSAAQRERETLLSCSISRIRRVDCQHLLREARKAQERERDREQDQQADQLFALAKMLLLLLLTPAK